MAADPAPDTLDGIFRALFVSGEKWPDWFTEYCGFFQDPAKAENYAAFYRYLFRRARIVPRSPLRVLDVGSGFGPACYLFHLMGFSEVHGLEIFVPMHETHARGTEILGLRDRIKARLGDASSVGTLYPPSHFDLVTCTETISHVLDLESFFDGLRNVLKVGGTFIVTDSNNPFCIPLRRRNRETWERFENGPPGKLYDTHVDKPYVEMRREIIARRFPGLAETECRELARLTSCLSGEQVLDAAGKFVREGKRPNNAYRYGQCPINPETNQYLEREFSPARLAKTLTRLGFKTRWGVYLGNPELHWKLALAVPVCDWLAWITQLRISSYYVIAVKRR